MSIITFFRLSAISNTNPHINVDMMFFNKEIRKRRKKAAEANRDNGFSTPRDVDAKHSLNCFKRNHRLHNRILVVSEGGLQGFGSKQNKDVSIMWRPSAMVNVIYSGALVGLRLCLMPPSESECESEAALQGRRRRGG